METLYVWLFIFAGATLVILGIFLLVSERELKKQRRELDELRRSRRISEAQGSETELMMRNQKLAEDVSSLFSQLEKSKRMVQELDAEQKYLLDQLHTSESLLSKTVSQHKEVAERDLQLESELAESRQQMDKLTMKNNELLEMTNSLSS